MSRGYLHSGCTHGVGLYQGTPKIRGEDSSFRAKLISKQVVRSAAIPGKRINEEAKMVNEYWKKLDAFESNKFFVDDYTRNVQKLEANAQQLQAIIARRARLRKINQNRPRRKQKQLRQHGNKLKAETAKLRKENRLMQEDVEIHERNEREYYEALAKFEKEVRPQTRAWAERYRKGQRS
jgi:hypothetical protein